MRSIRGEGACGAAPLHPRALAQADRALRRAKHDSHAPGARGAQDAQPRCGEPARRPAVASSRGRAASPIASGPGRVAQVALQDGVSAPGPPAAWGW